MKAVRGFQTKMGLMEVSCPQSKDLWYEQQLGLHYLSKVKLAARFRSVVCKQIYKIV